MASPTVIQGAIEVVFGGPTGPGPAAAPGTKSGAKAPTTPSLGVRDKAKSAGSRAMGMVGSAAAKVPGAGLVSGAASKVKPDPKLMEMSKQSLSNAKTTASKSMGISASLGSLLKQSQLFTGIIGTIFQILGMLVDVILMPFMPILVPVIKLLAKSVPFLMWWSKNVIGTAVKIWVAGFTFIVKFLAGVINLVWNKGIKPLIDWVWSKIGGPIMGVITPVANFVMGIVDKAKEMFLGIVNWLLDPMNWWSGPLHPFKVVFDIVAKGIELLVGGITKVWEIITNILGGVWTWLKGAWSGALEWAKGAISAVSDFIGGFFSSAVDFFTSIPGAISDFISGLWSTIKDWFATVWNWFKGIFEWINNTVVKPVWETIVGIAGWLKDTFLSLINTIWGGLKAIFVDFPVFLWNKLMDVRQWLIDKIKTWAADFVSGIILIKDFAVGIFQKIKDFFLGVWDTIKNWFISARQWIVDAFKAWLSNFVAGVIKIKDWAMGIFTKIGDFIRGIWDGAKDWFLDRVNSVKDFFTGIWDKAKAIIDFIKEKVSNIFDKIDLVRQKVLDIVDFINPLTWIPKIIEKIKSIIPGVGDVVDAIPGVGAVKNVASKLKFWQHGAIVRQPTLGIAGERGPEAIIPLRNLTKTAVSTPSAVNITVINRTPDGRENQEHFLVERNNERESEYTFEINQRMGLWGVT